jgi:hypothetical protein
MMDQRIGDYLYEQMMKAINYAEEEFDATEYEIVGALELAKATYSARSLAEMEESDEEDL